MKKSLILGTILALLVSSCQEKEVVTPAVTQQMYPNPTVKIGFTIHVLASSVSGRTSGLTGATVTVKQNGVSYTSTTDESGIVTFSSLIEGSVQWYVSKQGFSSFNSSTVLKYSGTPVVVGVNGTSTGNSNVTVSNEQQSSSSVEVSLKRLGAKVGGTIMADLDGPGSGQSAVVPSGTTLTLRLPDDYEPNIYTTTVQSGGEYLFENLPEGVTYTLEVVDLIANIAGTTTTPPYKSDLNFPSNQNSGTTPSVDRIDYRGLTTLQ